METEKVRVRVSCTEQFRPTTEQLRLELETWFRKEAIAEGCRFVEAVGQIVDRVTQFMNERVRKIHLQI